MKNSGKKFVVGCVVGAGVCLVGIVAVMVGIVIGLEAGWIPDTAAIPVGKIHPRQLKQLEEMDVIKPGEKVLYFYSASIFSIRGDGNLFTDQRVISYQEYDGKLELNDATYNSISSIDFEPSDSRMDDSTITVTLDDGSWFVLYVSTESNGDKTFYEKLTELWKHHRN